MKVAAQSLAPAMTSGQMVTTDVSISDDLEDQLMIMNVLSNTLYTDKPAACLREYGCNAFDANVEAGRGHQPIEVSLPNKLEPTLRVRDFGLGMDEQQITAVFLKLGRSTKRNSNAYTGMLGIGSKAGFAYGDSFMVTSYVEGTKTIYNLFRDQGRPRCAKMHEEKTEAPDGLEIKVPVRMEDFEEFRLTAERVYRHFKVRPIIHGAKVEFKDVPAHMRGKGWRYLGEGGSVAVMGNVGYQLTANGMGGFAMNPTYRTLLNLGVELDFEIGDLEITASREGLQYKDITKGAVIARLKVVLSEISDHFTKQIAGASCLWEAKQRYGEVFEQMGSSNVRSLKEIIHGQIIWKGKVIDTGRFSIENKEKLPGVRVFHGAKDTYRPSRIQKYTDPRDVYASVKTTLVVNDLPSKKMSPARMKGWFNTHADCVHFVCFSFVDEATRKKYWKARELEGAPTVSLSTITPAVNAAGGGSSGGTRAHNPKHSARAFVINEKFVDACRGAIAQSHWWDNTVVDPKNGSGVYVEIDCFRIQGIGRGERSDTFQKKVKALRKAGLLHAPVYGFKSATVAKLGPQWKKLGEVIAERMDIAVKKQGFPVALANYNHAVKHEFVVDSKHVKLFPPQSDMWDYLSEIVTALAPKSVELISVVQSKEAGDWLIPPALVLATIDLDKMKKNVLQKYPLLASILTLHYMSAGQMKNVADYVRLVESE